MVRAALATVGLVDENDPKLSSSKLVNSSLLRIKYFSATWKVHMLYIVKFLGVNIDTTLDKSLSRTSVQHAAQSKATTDKKSKKKRNPPSSKPRTSKIIRESSTSTQVTDTQHDENHLPPDDIK
ncbi:hypothetical protein Tco_0766454 [Tanacetum coccineum]